VLEIISRGETYGYEMGAAPVEGRHAAVGIVMTV